MVARYVQKTWVSEVITSADMNRMEYGISGRVYHVDPTGLKGDFASFTLAIAQCVVDGAGTIRAMSGLHTLAVKLTINGPQIAIVANKDATIKKGNNLNDNLIEITGSKSTLYGLIIDGNKANQGGGASDINIGTASDVSLDTCQFTNAYTHAIMWANNASSRRVHITNCDFSGSNTASIYGTINGTGYLRECYIEGCTFQGIVNEAIYFILANTSTDIWLVDNQIDGTSQAANMKGIFIDINTTVAIKVFIVENDVVSVTGTGIYAQVSYSRINDNHCGLCAGSGIEVYGIVNAINDNGLDAITLSGILFDDVSGGTEVANNNMFNIGRDGILVSDTNAMDCKITGNLIKNCGTSVNNTYSGIKLVGTTNFTVDGNSVIGKAANKHKYSVDEAGTGNFIINNTSKSDVSGGATLGVNITGAGSLGGGNLRIA